MNLNELQCSMPVTRWEPKDVLGNTSNCESEEEELPRPETVTVVQDELAEDSDPFPSHNSDPLNVDPLSLEHSIEPSCKPIKEELQDDSEVCVKIELSDSEDEISNASIDRFPEDDGYRSGSDEGVANRSQPESSHPRDPKSNINEVAGNKLNEILVEVANADVRKGTSAREITPKLKRKLQVHGVSENQPNVCSSVDSCFSEVQREIVVRFRDLEMEVTQNQDKRIRKERTVLSGPKVTSCLESDNSNTPLADTRQSHSKKNLRSTLNFPKRHVPKERAEEGANLLPLCNIERKLRVVLTRCKEAEILASTMTSAGRCDSNRENKYVAPVIHPSPNQLGENEVNSAEDPRKDAHKIKNTASVGDAFMSRGTKSIKVLITALAQDVENDLAPGGESKRDTSVSKHKILDSKEGQDFSEERDELEKQAIEGSGGTVRKFLLDNASDGAVLKSWSCSICHKWFDNPFAMSAHTRHCRKRRDMKISPPYTCKLCRKSFSTSDSLLMHSFTHRDTRKHKCHICGKMFFSLSRLKKHSQIHTGTPTYKCEVCAEEFSSVKGMNIHKAQKGHKRGFKKNQNRLKRGVQDKSNVSDLLPCEKHHLGSTTHTGQIQNFQELENSNVLTASKTFQKNLLDPQMPILGKVFSMDNQSAKYNKNSNTDFLQACEKSHDFSQLCEVCGKTYYNRQSFNRHKHSHEHKCGVCGMSLSVNDQLENHKCSFTKPVTSDEASKNLPVDSFDTSSCTQNKGHLKVNINSTMTKYIYKKRHFCRICQKSLANMNSFKQHMYLHTGKPFKCNFCAKAFPSRYRLNDHTRAQHTFEKPYECDLCDSVYSGSNSLRLHKKYKHNQTNVIKQQKGVKQQKLRHKLIDKTYKCQECRAIFTTPGNLKRHHKCFHLKGIQKESAKTYKCEYCEVSFKLPLTLFNHTRLFHSSKIKYVSALKSFSSDYDHTSSGKNITKPTVNCSTAEYLRKKKNFCKICNVTFTSQQALKVHMRLHSGKPFQCNFCDKLFTRSARLEAHKRSIHTFERPFQCNLCDKAYSGAEALRNHKNMKHKNNQKFKIPAKILRQGGQVHHCDECSATFSVYDNLVKHKNYYHLKNAEKDSVEENKCDNSKNRSASQCHSDKKPFECNYCTASYHYCKSFVKHLNQSHGIKETELGKPCDIVKCNLCHKRLNQKSLKRHKRDVHNVEEQEPKISKIKPRFDSTVCHKRNKKFNIPANLRIHTRYHQTKQVDKTLTLNSDSSDQFHKCDLCNAVFNQRKNLVEHKTSFHVRNKKKRLDFHSSRKYYKCNQCSAKYFSEYSLRRHKHDLHSEEQAFQCSVCLKSFSSAVILIKHHEKHFKKLNYSCSDCGKSFKQLQHLKEHKLTHNSSLSVFHCGICSSPFQTLDDLENHKKCHKFKSSIRIGRTECRELIPRNYKCDVCNKSYTRKDGLKRHKWIHANVCAYKCRNCGRAFREHYKLVLHEMTHSVCG